MIVGLYHLVAYELSPTDTDKQFSIRSQDPGITCCEPQEVRPRIAIQVQFLSNVAVQIAWPQYN